MIWYLELFLKKLLIFRQIISFFASSYIHILILQSQSFVKTASNEAAGLVLDKKLKTTK